jgi:MFS family permease
VEEGAMTDGGARKGWYYGWNIVAVTVLSQIAANGIPFNAFSLFVHDWSAELQRPISTLQLAIVPMIFVAALISPIIGNFADKFPARWLMSGGAFGVALFCLLISFISRDWQFFVLYGAFFPVVLTLSTSVVANAVVARWFVRRIGVALGITSFGVGLAGVLLPPIVADALPLIGWRGIWRVASLIIACGVVPLAFFVLRDRPTTREGLHYLADDGTGRRPHGHGAGGSGGMRWRDIMKRRNFWLLVVVFLALLTVYSAASQNFAPIVTSHGFSVRSAGLLLSVLNLSHIIATLMSGFVSDRFGNRIPFAALAMIVAAGAVTMAFGSSLTQLTVASVLIGLSGGEFTFLSAAIAREFGAATVGRAYGLVMFFLPVNALVPYGVAKVRETTGSYSSALLVLAAMAVAGGLIILLMRERGGQPLSAENGPLGDALAPTIGA